MKSEETQQIVNQFLDAVMAVRETQTWLLLTASHLRLAISKNEADARLMPMVEYLEKQGGNLQEFVRGLNNPPVLDLSEPVVEPKKPVDPLAN
jgi:hypothetical protein